MSTSRKLGVFLCVLGFLAVCVLALASNWPRPFNGLTGIQQDLAAEALAVVEVGGDAPQTQITAEGRNLRVVLPDVVASTFDRDDLERRLKLIEGVRDVEVVGDPVYVVAGDQGPEATVEPEPAPDPTDVAEPDPDPTAVPTSEPAPEPTEVPAPTLAQIVTGLDADAINFEPGTAALTGADQAVLDGIAEQLAGQTGGPIQVQAHTDNVGDPDVNLLLSQDRAAAVVDYLTNRGVDGSLLTSRGFGASQPIADNSTEQGRTDNRRVVFVVEGN